ncbi:hypothetical protein C8J56DRAFT_443437 [Mycena floridula]|nr:hypothetical protein C8J56DRAFT_443437 [Mycena floridula]
MVSFRLFRRILLGFVSSIQIISLAQTSYLFAHLPAATGKDISTSTKETMIGSLVFILALQLAFLAWSLISPYSKKIFKRPQSVAAEAVQVFSLLPFAIIITLSVLSSALFNENDGVFLALRILTVLQTIIHVIYTTALFTTALVTVFGFDPQVWSRDIDSSPSPFPMSLLMSLLCLNRQDQLPQSEMESTLNHICVPGCACMDPKLPMALPPPGLECKPSSRNSTTASLLSQSGVSLSPSLIRLPNDVERRLSIPISFANVDYEDESLSQDGSLEQ